MVDFSLEYCSVEFRDRSGKWTDRGKWIFLFRTPEKNGTKPDKVRNEKWIMSDPPILDVAILGRFFCTSYHDRYKSRFCSGKRTDRGNPQMLPQLPRLPHVKRIKHKLNADKATGAERQAPDTRPFT